MLDTARAMLLRSRRMRRSLRKIILLVLAVVALAALLYKFRNSITLEGFRWSVLGSSWRQANLGLLLLGIVSIYVAYAVRSARWVRISRYLGPSNFRSVYAATLMGFACVFLLGRAGEPIRPLLISRKEKLPMSGMFGVYVLERILDLGATAVFAGLALVAISHGKVAEGNGTHLMHAVQTGGSVLLVAFAATVIFLIYFRFHGAGAIAVRFEQSVVASGKQSGWRAKVAALIAGLSEGLHALRTWTDLALASAWTAAHWILIVFVYIWISHAFGGALANLDFTSAMLVLAFTLVGSAVQLPGVGGGAQVATFLVFTVLFGVEKEPAAAAAITIWLITFASSTLVGVPLLLREGWSMGELRRAAEAEERVAAEEAEEHMIADDESGSRGAKGGTRT
jgi:glycosyltransferase 2 family protein